MESVPEISGTDISPEVCANAVQHIAEIAVSGLERVDGGIEKDAAVRTFIALAGEYITDEQAALDVPIYTVDAERIHIHGTRCILKKIYGCGS